jgi:hypothetical protein
MHLPPFVWWRVSHAAAAAGLCPGCLSSAGSDWPSSDTRFLFFPSSALFFSFSYLFFFVFFILPSFLFFLSSSSFSLHSICFALRFFTPCVLMHDSLVFLLMPCVGGTASAAVEAQEVGGEASAIAIAPASGGRDPRSTWRTLRVRVSVCVMFCFYSCDAWMRACVCVCVCVCVPSTCLSF